MSQSTSCLGRPDAPIRGHSTPDPEIPQPEPKQPVPVPDDVPGPEHAPVREPMLPDPPVRMDG